MIRLYLVRHGIAAPSEQWTLGPDSERPLTPKGRARFRRAARAFAKLGEQVDLLATSPWVRAVQTAELLAAALKRDEVELFPELRSDEDPTAILDALAPRVKDGQGVALVGHDPHLTTLLVRAGQLTRDQAARVEFKKGAIVRIDVAALPETRPAEVRWWLRPKTRQLAEGPPLKRKPARAARS